MRILFLDDNPARARWAREYLCVRTAGDAHEFFPAATAAGAIALLAMSVGPAAGGFRFDVAYLDHDLDGTYQDPSEANTGSAVVRWAAANRPRVGRFVVHTMGNRGPAMAAALGAAGYTACYMSFVSLVKAHDPGLWEP